MPAIVEACDLTKNYGSFLAVDHVNIEVQKGEIFGFLGPNGAGKTTTVRLLCCLLRPTSGSASVAGYGVMSQPEKVRESIGLLPEVHGHYERLSAQENLEYYAQLYGVPPSETKHRVKELLEMISLWERRKDRVGTFSKGMKQKLAVARALIHDPPVLFLDEPTSALDPEAQKVIRDDILRLSKKKDRTIFICTHNLAEAETLCDRVAIINHGKIVVSGATERLRSQFWQKRIFELKLREVSDGIVKAMASTGVCDKIEVQGDTIVFDVSDPERDNPVLVQAVVKACGHIVSLSEVRRTLEEIYLKVMGETA